MKRLLTIALAAGIFTASCSGHGGQQMLPSTGGLNRAHANASIVAPAGWAATATQGVSILNAADNGLLNGSTPMTVRVGLNLHNVDQLKSLIASRQTISPSAFAAQFGPTQSEINAVVSYLQTQGLKNIQTDGQLVSADGTAAQISHAFNTKIEAFSLGGASLYANTQPAFVPQNLGGIVSAVLGLNNAAKMAVKPHTSPCFTPGVNNTCIRDFDPVDVQHFYDVGTTPTASNTTIAVIAEGDVSETVSDLRFAETTLHTPQVPVTVVKVGLSSPDTAGVVEWDLDTQSSTGIAGTVKMLYIYDTTSLTDSDIANAYSKWVKADVAQLGNSSFGECEYQAYLDGAMKVDDQLFMQAAAQGQTMFASSGDTGSSCALAPTNGAPGSGPPMVSYPAASPYAVAVGGTTVTTNATDSSYVGETAWNAGGGGLSQFENSTSWEQAAQPVSPPPAELALRGVPDIAMAADPNAGGFNIYGPNIPGVGACSTGCGIGGTSEASPLSMGAYARLLSAHNNTLGFAAPALYANYLKYNGSATTVTGPPPTQAYGGFHDIITGVNGAYSALPGYDYTTGVGSIDITAMNNSIGT